MQTTKRLLSLALALVMVLSIVPATVFAADSAPALPTAKISQIKNDDLTFAMNFRVNSVTEEQLAYYGNWYADFELTINKEVTFNNDGSADGWLAGQYDEWSYNWVTVPFGKKAPVTVKANETVKIMAFAAELLDEPGLKYTFKEVYETVKDFNCGVYFDDEFLANNPDLEVTLELKMYNPANEAESYIVGETYTYTNPIVAKNINTGKVYTSVNDAMMAAQVGETVVLLKDVSETIVSVFEDATLDLNGYTLAAQYVSCFGDIIDSSAANAGLLSVSANRFMIREDNAQLPIRNGNGYRFVEVLKFNAKYDAASSTFGFQPFVEAGALEWLKEGSAATGVTIQVQITWKQSTGYRSQNFVYNDTTVNDFLGSYISSTGKYGKMLFLTLKGAENFDELTFTATVVSDAKVSFTPDSLAQQKPTGNVTTNAQNQVVNDVTIGNGNASALVPSGTQLENGAYNVTLNATEMEKTTSNITLGDGEQLVSMNVHVDGVAANNTKPIIVTLANLAPEALNQGNLELYHVENGETVLMTRVYSIEEVDAHNEYYYDIATGTVTMALATFSEIAARSVKKNTWNGNIDTDWYYTDTYAESFLIYNADQLAGLGQLVDNGNTFSGKTIYLGFDIDLEGYAEDGATRLSFNPIGYGYETSGGQVFKGIFKGQGHTIRNLYQNGWDLGLSYSTAGGGLFASAVDAKFYDLTIDNAYVVMECIDMGALVGYAYGTCRFENIVVSNSTIANYNRYTGGVVGEVNGSHTFINVDVPSSTTISALWGTFDPAIGGIIGGVYGGANVYMELCDVAAVLDVFNDVTSAYRWYSYRRCGMLIGYTEESKTENGRTEATASFLTTVGCTVQYGDWAHYHYCEFSNEYYPYVRVEAGLFNDAYSNPRYGNPVGADGITKINKDNHNPKAHKTGEDCTLPVYFHQLYGGGQGCYGGNQHVEDNLGVTEITNVTAAEKFVAKIPQGANLITGHTYTLGELFAASGLGEKIQNLSMNAYVSAVSVDNAGDVSGTFVRENNWADSKLTLSGKGTATITINDYYYCTPTVITVNVVAPAKIGDTEYNSVQDALNAAKDGETVTLQANVPVSQYLDIFTEQFGKEERSITLDLNGYTISWSADYKYAYYPLVFVGINQTVTIKNGSIIANEHVAVGAYGHVNLVNVEIESKKLSAGENAVCIWNWSEADEYYQDCQFLITGSATISGGNITGGILAEGPVTLKDADIDFDALYLNNKTGHGKINIALVGYGLEKKDGYYTNLHKHEYVDGACTTCGLTNSFVLTDLADITSTDIVVITMAAPDGTVYAIINSNGTAAPTAVAVKVADDRLISELTEKMLWNIANNNDNLTIYPNGTIDSWLYCIHENNGVRVGTNTNSLFTIVNNYLYHTETGRYLGVYNGQDWRCYTTINDNIKNQTLAFYVLKTNCDHANTEERAEIAATCTQAGHAAGTYCLDCDTYTEGGALINALGHTLGEYETIKEATCTANGKARAHCTVCNKVSTVTVPMISHNYGDNDLCTVCGSKRAVKYVFSGYTAGTQYAENEVHKLDDDITVITTQSHFTTELRIYDSVHEGSVIINVAAGKVISGFGFQAGYKDATLKVYGLNSAGEWELIEAVAVTSAYDDYEINFNGKLYTSLKLDAVDDQVRLKDMTIAFAACKHINSTEHAAQNATCTEAGYTAGVYCEDCNNWTSGHEEIAATGHVNTTTTTVNATCTEAGSTTVTCKDCNAALSTTPIAALGHNWQAASCTAARTCSVCGTEDGAPLGHDYQAVVTAPTCITDGYTTHTCANCQDTYTDSETPKTGVHNFGDNGICTTEGCNEVKPVTGVNISFHVSVGAAPAAVVGTTITLPTNVTAPEGYEFVGWATAHIQGASSAEFHRAGTSYTAKEDTTLYAVYAKTVVTGGSYVQKALAEIEKTDVVVITIKNSSGVYALNSGNGTGSAPAATKVTVSGNALSGDIADALKWNIDNNNGELTIYPNGVTNKWLYCTATNNGVRVGTNANKVFTIDASSGYLKHTGTSRYVGIYNSQDWRCYTSTSTNIDDQTLAFYILNAGNEETTYYTCIEHDWQEATCQSAKTCTVCGVEEGELGDHNYVDGTCSVCGDKEPTKSWVQVTDVSSLKAGDKIIIVSGTKVAGSLNGSYLSSVEFDAMNLSESALIFTLGGSSSAWTLTAENGKLLGTNAAKSVSLGSGTTTWTISISNGNATVKSTKTTCGWLQYNSSAPRFTTYTSSQTTIQLYKLV